MLSRFSLAYIMFYHILSQLPVSVNEFNTDLHLFVL
jgi:hypothetical protein